MSNDGNPGTNNPASQITVAGQGFTGGRGDWAQAVSVLGDSYGLTIVSIITEEPNEFLADKVAKNARGATSLSWPPCGEIQELSSFSLARHAGAS